MREMGTHGIASTQERCARTFGSKAFDPIRHKPLVQTTAEDLLSIVHNNGHAIAHYLRRLHNLACDLGWLAWPILAKRVWPKIRSKHRRAVMAEEHAAIISSEKNPEKRAYYEFLYETGAAQSDAAELAAESIDWQDGLLVYHRKKLGPDSEPARLSIGRKLRELLESLPKTSDLFPTIKTAKPNARSTEFRRRCRIAGVSGVSLHSYRHSWAQRAKACGYPLQRNASPPRERMWPALEAVSPASTYSGQGAPDGRITGWKSPRRVGYNFRNSPWKGALSDRRAPGISSRQSCRSASLRD